MWAGDSYKGWGVLNICINKCINICIDKYINICIKTNIDIDINIDIDNFNTVASTVNSVHACYIKVMHKYII